MPNKNVYIKNLPLGITKSGLCDLLWEKLGLQINSNFIDLYSHDRAAVIKISTYDLVAFFNLQLRDTGLVFEVPQPQLSPPQTTVRIRECAGDTNRNGIRKL